VWRVRTILLAHVVRPDCWLATVRHTVHSCSRRCVVAAKHLLCWEYVRASQALDVSETYRKRLVVRAQCCVCRHSATERSNLATAIRELFNIKTVKCKNCRWQGTLHYDCMRTVAEHCVYGRLRMWYDIFIYCGWVSTRWQRSVDLYKNMKETALYKRRYNTQSNTKEREREREKTNVKIILKNVSRVIIK